MFRRVREFSASFLAALQAIGAELVGIRRVLQDGAADALSARVDELERSRAIWEAEVEGVLAKAQQERQAARSAEERTRYREKKLNGTVESLEGDAAGEGEIPPEYLALLRGGDAGGGEEEGLQPMPARVGRRRRGAGKDAAKAFKFGG